MRRRRFLAGVALAGGTTLAGCLGDDSPTALEPTEREELLDEAAIPTNGDELPSATVDAPLHGDAVATDAFVGDRETLLTFIFTRCPGPCLTLTNSLAHVQTEAASAGYSDEVALMPTTFDPEHDTADVLAGFCEDRGADPHADNWYALRPETPDEAASVVNETFGVFFEEVPMDESTHGDHGEHGDQHDETTFNHTNLLVLANRDGYVERAYTGNPPSAADVLDDLETVRDRFA